MRRGVQWFMCALSCGTNAHQITFCARLLRGRIAEYTGTKRDDSCTKIVQSQSQYSGSLGVLGFEKEGFLGRNIAKSRADGEARTDNILIYSRVK